MVVLILLLTAGTAHAQNESATAVAAGLTRPDDLTLPGPKHLVHDISPHAENGLVRVVIEIPAG